MTKTSIEWTKSDDGFAGETWNPTVGCTKVSPGCDSCYAIRQANMRAANPHPKVANAYADTVKRGENGLDWTGTVNRLHDRLDEPLRWRKPRRVFVNSMSDLFHDAVPSAFIAAVFDVMRQTPQHTYMILTKRHARMRSLMRTAVPGEGWPLPNVWLGVSVEDQKRADLRIPALLETSAAVRFLSCEPLLGPLDLSSYLTVAPTSDKVWCPTAHRQVDVVGDIRCTCNGGHVRGQRLRWIICGGESGPDARPMHPDWARRLRDQCQAAGTPYFFKQWGDYLPVPVVDDLAFSGGRAFDDPRGGRAAAVIQERGGSGSFRSGSTRPMRAGDRNGFGQMLDDDTLAVRRGKGRAGRELDGRTWDEFPAVVHA